MVTSHDTGYKALFSHPEFVEALLDGFVPHSISRLLDYRTLNNEPGHYITPLFEEKIEDVVWSVQFRPDNSGHTQTLYLYILLEFQSSVDAGMPLRMLLYSAAFYHQLLKHKKLPSGQKLPAVFPVVLYNGKARWTPPTGMLDMLQPVPAFLQPYQPQLNYHLVDVQTCLPAAQDGHDNLLQLVFNVENAMTAEAMQRVAWDVARAVREHPQRARIDQVMVRWFKRFLHLNRITIDLNAIHQVQEIPPMLADRVETWFEQWKQQGLAEGRELGREQGSLLVLQRQLTRRFGPLDDSTLQRLQQAGIQELECWADNILDAKTLDEVFDCH